MTTNETLLDIHTIPRLHILEGDRRSAKAVACCRRSDINSGTCVNAKGVRNAVDLKQKEGRLTMDAHEALNEVRKQKEAIEVNIRTQLYSLFKDYGIVVSSINLGTSICSNYKGITSITYAPELELKL